MNKKNKKVKNLVPVTKGNTVVKNDTTLCIICKKVKGVLKITGAKQYPDMYNGKPICTVCNADREMLKVTK